MTVFCESVMHTLSSSQHLHQCKSHSHCLWGHKSYLPIETFGPLYSFSSITPHPYNLEIDLTLLHWPLQLLTALRTITILCAVRDLLLSDAVFIGLPVSPWASADPGLKAASAQDLPTRKDRRGEERIKLKEF